MDTLLNGSSTRAVRWLLHRIVSETVDEEEGRALLSLFPKARIPNTDRLLDLHCNITSLRNSCTTQGISISQQDDTALNKLEALLPHDQTDNISWNQAQGWRSSGIKETSKGAWNLPMKS
ncbi:hypothetical protein R1sor_013098 [Riccia sorocarpa]|uniref:Uncharacterized protein n=1 Tax=Riccia sorocarpa TaxID=122646 RepID=A0ABD3H8E2_9MARC